MWMKHVTSQVLHTNLSRDDIVSRLTERDVMRVYEALGVDRFQGGGPANWRTFVPWRDNTHTPAMTIRKHDGVWSDKATGDAGSIFDAVMRAHGCSFPEALAYVTDIAGMPTDTQPATRGQRTARRIVATYDYIDEHGKLLFQTVRYEPKDFKQRQPDGRGGWVWNLSGVLLVPYRLPELLAADAERVVFIVEGERDADALAALGLIVTTCPMGAGTWRDAYREYFAGRHVVILADNDDPGWRHAQQIAASLSGIAASVKAVELPNLGPRLPKHGKDVSDWLAGGGTHETLHQLVVAAPEWQPPAEDSANDAESASSTDAPRLVIRPVSAFESRPVDWLWRDWLACGKLTVFAGVEGDGKSYATSDIVARLSQGSTLPDDSRATACRVLILAAEDDVEDTIRPRLERHGANLDDVMILEAVAEPDKPDRLFSIGRHLPLLREAIERYDLSLIVIDPLSSFLPQSNRNDEGEIRDLLTPLAQLARESGVAILGLGHLNRPNGTQRRPTQRILGSTAFGAVARTVWMLAPANDAQDATRRVLAVVKSNVGLKPKPIEWSLAGVDEAITWHGASERDISELLSGSTARPRDDAEGFLRGMLAEGPKLSTLVEAAAEGQGVSPATLRRAKQSVGVESRKVGHGREAPWYWGLPATDWDTFKELVDERSRRDGQSVERGHLVDSEPSRLDAHPYRCSSEHLIASEGANGHESHVDANMLTSHMTEHLVPSLDAHLSVYRGEHLVETRETSRCIDCGEPCGTATRCSPCAAAGVRRRG
jgi:hypothetical protein